MKVDKREFEGDTFVLLICESETEAQLLDLVGVPGDWVGGELALSAGVGEFYLRLKQPTNVDTAP